MKTKIKRHGRSVISVILAVCLLISCMTVGLIATDAAKVTDSTVGAKTDDTEESIGAKDESEEVGATYYLYYRTDNTKSLSGMTAVKMTSSGSNYTAEFTASSQNFVLAFGNSSSATSSLVRSTWTLTKDSGIANWSKIEDSGGVYFVCGWATSGTKITVTFNGTSSVSLASSSSGGSTGSKTYVVTGDNAITGTNGWSNNSSANTMSYDSTLKRYVKTYTVSYTSGSFRWRIVESGKWDTTWGYNRSNEVDQSNICTYADSGSDNNIQMTLSQKANITIQFDDTKSDTSAITVIITPAQSTVTTAVTPAAGGTATVNEKASVSNIDYGTSVSLVATPAANYHFDSWSADNASNISFTSSTSASTTATVLGTATVTANFAPDSFTVTKNTDASYKITAPTAGTAQYTSTVSVSATASDAYYIDGLYYKEAGSDETHTIFGDSETHTTNASLSNKTFTMPASNVTIYAWTHEKGSQTIKYTAEQTGGYVSVGRQHGSSHVQIEQSYKHGDKVVQETKVNFCAIPKVGHYFDGWYTDSELSTAASETTKDMTVTAGATGDMARYAKFSSIAGETNKVKLLIPITNGSNYLNIWDSEVPASDGAAKVIDKTKIATYKGTDYYIYIITVSGSNTKCTIRGSNENWNVESNELGKFNSGSTYVVTWNGTGSKNNGSAALISSDTTTQQKYPISLNVVNPEKAYASTSTYVNAYATKSTSVNVTVQPKDADNKANVKVLNASTSASIKDQDYKSTSSGNVSFTMPSNAGANVTVTYKDKDYYKVTFSAGAGGTISATAGGTTITSGSMVQEGKTVVFTAEPNSGYSVSGWTGSGDLTPETTSTATSKEVESLSTNTESRVYFSKSKGADNTVNYIVYRENYDNPEGWYSSKTYVRNGRVYGYFDTPNASKYNFQVCEGQPTTDAEKCTKQKYRDNNATWANTQFTGDITSIQRKNYNVQNGTCYYINFTTSANVIGVMIDLGPSDNGNARPDQDSNTYHIIPIYNTDAANVTVYAKDGSYRGNSSYDYFPGIADTVITADGINVTGRMQHSEFETAVAQKGKSITVTTTIDANHKDKFYVRGYSVNGVTPALYNYRDDGVYTMTYTIPADFEDDYLEITPIYYYKHTGDGTDFADSNMVQFYIENYDAALQAEGWGNTLSVYPYYQNASGEYVATKHNAFGGYPGQPVINYGGRRFIEIPIHYTTFTVDNGNNASNNEECFIKGMTLSNDYYDIVHRDYCRAVDDHLQTYDYDDFYKIAKETSDGKEVNGRTSTADQITFAFKYRDDTNNFGDSTNELTTYAKKGTYTGQTVKAPYTDFTAEDKNSKFGNGWEPLLDYHDRPVDLFGKQLTTAEQAQDPVLVVSDDYAINYVGCYATTWTVYVWNSTTSKYENKGEIAPSALIVSSAGRLDDSNPYPAVKDSNNRPSQIDKKLSSYKTVYQALETYRGRPVQITYESAIKNDSSYEKHWDIDGVGSSEVSKRNDGRWFYSYEGEKINANLRIEYKNAGEDDTFYVTDSFREGTNKGVVTGATVQFNNTTKSTGGDYPLDGYRDTVDYNEDHPDNPILSNQNDYFNFTATPGSGYIFAGWWFERDGIVTPVNEDITKLTGSSQMTSNATFVARYIKNPSGYLTINHTLADTSVGAAKTYVGVKATKNGTTTWLTGAGGADVEGYVEDGFTISDAAYTSYNSGAVFTVILKTVTTNDFTAFDRFSSAADESADYFSTADQATSGDTTTTSFTVNANDLFELENSFPVQQFNTLTYYSHTKTKELTYKLEYSYDPYLGKYGRQGYDVTGTLSYEDLNEYFKFADVTGYSVKKLVFNNSKGLTDKQDDFLNKMAPYENNFMQNNYWNTADATIVYGTADDINIKIDESRNLIDNINVTLYFPYEFSDYAGKHAAQTASDGKVHKVENVTQAGVPHKYNDVYSLNSTTSVNHPDELPDPEFIKAPDTIWTKEAGDSGYDTPWTFQYWSVKTVNDENNGKHESVEYTRCYSKEFNFALFQDIILEPVYKQAGDTTPEDNIGATITFIENSRNQYNAGKKGSASTNDMPATRNIAGDRIYSDFLISFGDNMDLVKKEQLNTNAPGTKYAGLIIETVGDIEKVDDKYTTKSDSYYKSLYGGTLSEISEKLSGKDVTVNRENEIKNFIKTHGNKAEVDNLIISEFDVTKLDNKNRVQYYYSLPNRKHQTLEDSLTRRFKVYRAYSYLRDADNSKIEISQVPVYFTIYDIGSIQNYAEAQAGGGYKS